MKKNNTLLLNLFLLNFCIYNCIFAQTFPSNLSCGEQTRTWIKENYFDNKIRLNSITYETGRRYMYAYVDNSNNIVTCVYGGYQHNYTPSPTPTSPVQSSVPSSWATSLTTNSTLMINAEHTVPQSLFNELLPMRGDIHHLFPTYVTWNSQRSNYRFADVPDHLTSEWERNLTAQNTIPTTNIDEYSERGTLNNEIFYEPREDHKGRLARAILYFFTVYPTQAGNITTVAELSTLKNWHEQRPPNNAEVQRNNRVEAAQGNRNPYIDNPSWIYQAWCLTAPTLPAEFTSFKVVTQTNNNKLTWQVLANNILSYRIQRSVNAANDWQDLDILKANEKQEITNYDWIDYQPLPISFYRIKATEKTGKEIFSNIIAAQQAQQNLVFKKLIHSPNNNVLTLAIESAVEKEGIVEIFDFMGQKRWDAPYHILEGENSLFLNVPMLSEGMFIVSLKVGDNQIIQKFFR